jgi:hypothetical protein
MPSAALLWAIVVIGPNFAVEARWAQRFLDRTECEIWLANVLRQRATVILHPSVTPECQRIEPTRDEIEE